MGYSPLAVYELREGAVRDTGSDRSVAFRKFGLSLSAEDEESDVTNFKKPLKLTQL